jgi:phosphoserine phosphatase
VCNGQTPASEILCLIADLARAPLRPELVAEVGRAVGARPHWLAEAGACELTIETQAGATLVGSLRPTLEEAGVDVALVPAVVGVKRLLVSDMDSAVMTVECIDEAAGAIGIPAEVAAITGRAMDGELDFRTTRHTRVALLASLPVGVLSQIESAWT